jgi:tRNA 2-selenouridine synthase
MQQWASEKEWQDRLLKGGVFLDVRAPVEFTEGTLPGSVNVPILNDQERHEVGLCYKRRGPDAALETGHRLVSGEVKQERVRRWSEIAGAEPDLILFCFRGGQRSAIAQTWLKEAGFDVPRIEGGYKKVRQFLLGLLGDQSLAAPIHSVAGHTGSGKTMVLRGLARDNAAAIVDLEDLANHRGSAFGQELTGQPSQAQFENELALELWRAGQTGKKIWVEDEARTIGRVTLPETTFAALRSCPLIVIDEPRETRAQLILEEYVIEPAKYRLQTDPANAWDLLSNSLIQAILHISRKLGGARTQDALELLNRAVASSRDTGRYERHLEWIVFLLENYYDTFYENHMSRHESRVIFKGSRAEVSRYIAGDSN